MKTEDLISCVCRRNYDHPGVTDIEEDLLKELLEFCLKPKIISVGTEYYSMNTGVVMGSPLSGVLAN